MSLRPALFLLFSLLCAAGPAAAAEVLASIRPLALIAQAVTGEKVAVQQLVPNGASSHDYQLRPSDRLLLGRADVILWVGPAHEQFLARSIAASKATVITVQKLPELRLLPQRRLDGSAALPGTVDPHIWLDSDNAAVIARALAEALAKKKPAQAALYRRHAAEFATRLAVLKARQSSRFQGLPVRSFVAYHDAYQYLESPLGLQYRGSVVASAESKPSAKHFLLLSQKIRKEGIGCLLAEPGFDEALARNVFSGRPARLVAVDELFAAVPSDAAGYETGLSLMLDGVYHCLSGS